MSVDQAAEKPDAAAARAMLCAIANLGEDELAFLERRLRNARLAHEESFRRDCDY